MSEKCGLCGEPMPEGEQMFKFHGYSGDCPKPPLKKDITSEFISEETKKLQDADQALWLKAEALLLEEYDKMKVQSPISFKEFLFWYAKLSVTQALRENKDPFDL